LGAAALLKAVWWNLRRASLLMHLFVCLLATLRKKFQTGLHEIFRVVDNWPMNK